MLLTRPYFRERTVTYARRWALSRNPLFADFTGKGGDCTNFVSQCVLAGCCTENFTPTFGWYYISLDDRAPAFSGVEYFYNFMTGYGGYPPNLTRVGPLGIEVGRGRVEPGDVVQLCDRGDDFYHTLLVSKVTPEDIFVCAHSDDALDRPLSSYRLAAGQRFIHIQAALVEYMDDDCFDRLITGGGNFAPEVENPPDI